MIDPVHRRLSRRIRAAFCFALLGAACVPMPPKQFVAPPRTADHSLPDQAEVLRQARDLVAGSDLIYVSDYFSFVGTDGKGHVCFAIDNNRGRDGASYQADQRNVLHDERSGWKKLAAPHVVYPNPSQALWTIPDSPDFRWIGDAQRGWKVEATHGALTLAIDPLVVRTFDRGPGILEAMSSAPAALEWNGRTLNGRVICEYLVMRGGNWLTRRPSLAAAAKLHFEGLYLRTAEGGDVYAHGMVPPAGGGFEGASSVLGFDAFGSAAARASDLRLRTTAHAFALVHRWPSRWKLNWTGSRGPASVDARTVSRSTQSSWVIGGYAMSVVSGTMTLGSASIPVYGFAEIID